MDSESLKQRIEVFCDKLKAEMLWAVDRGASVQVETTWKLPYLVGTWSQAIVRFGRPKKKVQNDR